MISDVLAQSSREGRPTVGGVCGFIVWACIFLKQTAVEIVRWRTSALGRGFIHIYIVGFVWVLCPSNIYGHIRMDTDL